MKDIEIEIQVSVEDTKPLLKFLEKEAKYVGEEYQKDEYFTPAHRNFLDKKPAVEWLRIRKTDEYSAITYKNNVRDKDGKMLYRDEYETKIESDVQLYKIFKALDISTLITVEKRRKVWMFEDWEIALDNVTGLGEFVEVEYKSAEEVDPKSIMNEMITFLKKVGVGKIEINHVGYPYLLLFGIEKQFEEV